MNERFKHLRQHNLTIQKFPKQNLQTNWREETPFAQGKDRGPIAEETSDSEYESATEEVNTASLESPIGIDYKAAFREAIKSLSVQNDNEFQQVEMDIMALAKESSIEEAEVNAVLEAFVLKLDGSMKPKNRTRSKERRRRGDFQKNKDT